MNISMFDSEAFCGYTQKTTFWMDFSIADNFGKEAVKDTFKRAFEEWKGDYIYLTELVMVMNWKLWQWYDKDEGIAEVYNYGFEKARDYAYKHLKGDELTYFLRTID